jgi:hypothetical protein
MDPDQVKLVTPIATFILGSALTLALKATESRRNDLRGAAREAMRLTKDSSCPTFCCNWAS